MKCKGGRGGSFQELKAFRLHLLEFYRIYGFNKKRNVHVLFSLVVIGWVDYQENVLVAGDLRKIPHVRWAM
jgi:hypothetical protein